MKLPDTIQPFYVMELLARAKALEQAVHDVVHMEVGEPDFPTPPLVVNAGIEFLAKGEVKYTPAAGLPALREAISRFYAQRYGIDVPARRIFVTPGASGSVLLALAGLIERGGEVLLSDPGYPCYPNFVRLLGGEPRFAPVGAESNYQFDAATLERHWTPKAQGVVMASPSNPTGTMANGATLQRIAEFLDEKGGFWLSDEIYHGLVYGEPARSALEFSDQAFVVNSFEFAWRLLEEAHVAVTPGKDFGMNQPQRHLRFAYAASVERLVEGVKRIRDFAF